MQRKNIIIVQDKWTHVPEVFGNLKKACNLLNLPYHSLSRLKFPIQYKDVIIYRVPFK